MGQETKANHKVMKHRYKNALRRTNTILHGCLYKSNKGNIVGASPAFYPLSTQARSCWLPLHLPSGCRELPSRGCSRALERYIQQWKSFHPMLRSSTVPTALLLVLRCLQQEQEPTTLFIHSLECQPPLMLCAQEYSPVRSHGYNMTLGKLSSSDFTHEVWNSPEEKP